MGTWPQSNAADALKHGAAAYVEVSSTTVGVHSSIWPSSPPAKLSKMERYGSTTMPQVCVVTTGGVPTFPPGASQADEDRHTKH